MEFIVYEQKGAYGVITINRERALNALNSQVLEELDATLDAVNLDEVRCLILTIVEHPIPPPIHSVARPVLAPLACIS